MSNVRPERLAIVYKIKKKKKIAINGILVYPSLGYICRQNSFSLCCFPCTSSPPSIQMSLVFKDSSTLNTDNYDRLVAKFRSLLQRATPERPLGKLSFDLLKQKKEITTTERFIALSTQWINCEKSKSAIALLGKSIWAATSYCFHCNSSNYALLVNISLTQVDHDQCTLSSYLRNETQLKNNAS